jgi:hypothetical protein
MLLMLLCGQLFAEPAESSRTPETQAEAAEADQLFNRGKQLFAAGQYADAKAAFDHVLISQQEQGEVSAAVYYNLGSVCYRLEDFDCARKHFQRLARDDRYADDYAALAYYNLALVENRDGNPEAAVEALQDSRAVTSDPKLIALVNKQLAKLRKTEPRRTTTSTVKDWHSFVYLRHGYDSNIRFAPLEVASNESGDFLQFIGTIDKRIVGEGSTTKEPGLFVNAVLFATNYYSTDFNDFSLLNAGIRYDHLLHGWRNRIAANYTTSTYGKDDYLESTSLTLQTRKTLANDDQLQLRYRYEDIDSLLPVYDYLRGSRQRLRVGYQLTWPQDIVQLWYELELNDRQNTVSRNYSPTRHTLRLRYETMLDRRNRLYGEYAFRDSDYEPTLTQDRKDERSLLTLAYVNDFAPGWQAEARWRFFTNRSTDTIYSYDRHIVFLSVRKLF